jgi:hypothetical protein
MNKEYLKLSKQAEKAMSSRKSVSSGRREGYLMDLNLAVIILLPAIAVIGFLFLAQTILMAWKSPVDRKGGFHGDLFKTFSAKHSTLHSDCYDDCMRRFHWQSVGIPVCVSSCKV